MTIRDVLRASWEATVRAAEAGTGSITPSAFAGMTLAMVGHDAVAARRLLSCALGSIDALESEERAHAIATVEDGR